ncbi:MAG: lysophospholipid acyltransferase family protein [Pseudomonadota bacterium]|nr:lysophospholipid acyltransferase family protein [Pseudomonadota bacterium]
MIKQILSHQNSQKFLGWIISVYIKICYHSSLWYVKNSEIVDKQLRKKKSIIVCFWHSRLLMASFCWNYKNDFKMLISGHRDGKIISNAVSHLGIKTITGSSRKKKISSLKEIITEIKENSILGITPDGPKGPNQKIKDGFISLLKKTNVTVIPLSYSAKFKIQLKTWDKFMLVTPFNKFVAVWGNPIVFEKKKSIEENQNILENEINRVTLLANNLSK